MKVLYGPEVCGLMSACTIKLLEKFIETAPEYLECDQESNLHMHPMWEDNEKNVIHGCYNAGDKVYCLDITWRNDYGKAMRTDPRVIELFEEYGNRGKENRPLFKVVDLPDDMEWDVCISDVDSESIHEKHRAWY